MSDASAMSQKVTVAEIQRTVAGRYSMSVNDMVSKCRSHDLIRPRFIAVYLASTLTQLSTTVIGRLFGGRDHTTIIRTLSVMHRRVAEEPALRQEIDALAELAVRRSRSSLLKLAPPAMVAFDRDLNAAGFELAIVPFGTRDAQGFATCGVAAASTDQSTGAQA
jgi:hypothetical protein